MNDHAFASRAFNGPPLPPTSSSMYGVLERMKVHGNQNGQTQRRSDFEAVQEKYALDIKWKTGYLNKFARRAATNRQQVRRKQRREQRRASVAELLSLI